MKHIYGAHFGLMPFYYIVHIMHSLQYSEVPSFLQVLLGARGCPEKVQGIRSAFSCCRPSPDHRALQDDAWVSRSLCNAASSHLLLALYNAN